MTLSQKIKLSSLLAVIVSVIPATAQNYRLPGQHKEQTENLLANQSKVGHTISVDPNIKYLDYEDESEPEGDIYEEGWNSNRVNCYANVNVPQRAVIDVSHYHMPHPGAITSPYGYRPRFKRMHKGVDIHITMGDTIRAAFDGRIRIVNYERAGYGNYVVIRHNNDLETVYGHLTRSLVKPDQYVKAGDPIALGGNTGRSTGPHLHFETRYMGYAINPAAIFDFPNQTTHTDTYTFDKNTYQRVRNYDPAANAAYAAAYEKQHSSKSKANKQSSSNKSVKVKKGDSLAKIASRNHTTVSNLCSLNGLKSSSKIKPGQTIRVR
jgi:murein DD-endopeptidase MepM/ murein hydrolase activator NlpD